jgi:pyrroline-5-carboxylate reductase
MKVAIVGGGVMGEAILAAALERGVLAASDVVVAEVVEARRAELAERYGVQTTAVAADAIGGAEMSIISVKPQDAHSVTGRAPASALLVSIMAGVRIATLAAEFGHDRIVRVMPNTPAAVNAGMSVWTATAQVTEEQRQSVRGLLAAIGRERYVAEEKKIDMATALSGSGPAYVFMFVEAMVEGGVLIGLSRAEAEEMALQTVYGSALYALKSGQPAGVLRGQVTSPAGTTAAGLLELERGSLRASVIEAVRAAHDRAIELGGPK